MNLLPSDESGYPYVYHIVDVKNILVKVNNANSEIILNSFDQVKKYYIEDLENTLAKDNNEDEEISNNECDDANTETKENNNEDGENNKTGIELKNNNMEKLMLKQREILQNNQLEQKKLVEKVEILNVSAEKFRTKFLKDIKKVLHNEGIFILEHADLLSIINTLIFCFINNFALFKSIILTIKVRKIKIDINIIKYFFVFIIFFISNLE